MGIRSTLKDTAKAILGRAPARPATSGGTTPSTARPTTLPTQPAPDGSRAVAFSDRVPEGGAGTFPFQGIVIAVFRKDGRLYAVDNACRHEDGPVGEGTVAGCKVRCPYHEWEYDFTTGRCVNHPEASLATYAVREDGGVIWVGRRLTEGTAARGGEHNDGLETIVR